MRRIGKILVYAIGGCLLYGGGFAATRPPSSPDKPYDSIAERNVFGLREPVQPTMDAPPAPPSKITLTGITTILGNKLAIMKAQIPAKPGEPAKELPIMLNEGQREGGIEVLEVNEKAGSVKVKDFGTVTTLTFERNGVKAPTATPLPTGQNAATGSNAAMIPTVPINSNAVGQAGFTNPLVRHAPTRSLRLPAPEATAISGAPPAPSATTPPLPAVAPVLPVLANPPQLQPGAQESQLTAEEQQVLNELERAKNIQNVAPVQSVPANQNMNQVVPVQPLPPLRPQ